MSDDGNQFVYMLRMRHTDEVVDLYTEYGANGFLKQRDKDVFSSDLKKADAIRKKGKKKKKLNAADKNLLCEIYNKLLAVVQVCDATLFGGRVRERGIKDWQSHAVTGFRAMYKVLR